MTLLGNGFRRILLLIVIAVCLILVALNIILNIKLRAEFPGLIEKFSKETPYDIDVGKISLDLLFRVQFDKVSVTDPSLEQPEVLNIRQLTVSPNIISSLLTQRIELGEIVLKTPVVQSNKENVNNLVDFIKSISNERKDAQDQMVKLSLLKILQGDFQITPKFLVSVPNLVIELSDNNLEKAQAVAIGGNIGLLEKELSLEGNILISSEKTSGELLVDVEKISPPSILSGTKNLKAANQISFVISDLITLEGDITLDAETGIFSEKSLASAKYSLSYDKTSDSAELTSLDFTVPDLISGSFSGQIEQVTKQTVFKLAGSADPLDIEQLMVKVLGDDSGRLSGELSTEQLKITGSRAKGDIRVTGDVSLAAFNFKSDIEDDPNVSGVACDLKFKQDFGDGSSFSLSSNGTCTADKFLWDKTGSIDEIKATVNLSSTTNWSDNKITLSNITSSYMDGSATGTLNFLLTDGLGGGITSLHGDISGSNLNLEKIPKAIIPANIGGNARYVNAKFEGASSSYTADISLVVEGFILKSNKEREFRVSKLSTSGPFTLDYKSVGAKEGVTVEDEILIKGGGVSYKKLSFEEYQINSGTVKNFEFFLELGQDRWALNMSSRGSGFSVVGFDVSLESFNESLSIQNSGREGFKGTISGAGGRYKSIEFPSLSWDYNFIGDRVIVENVSTQISTIGQFKTDELYVGMGSEAGGYPYKIEFQDATFVGFEEKLNSHGIVGEFVINKPGATNLDWQGTVNIKQTTIVSAVIDNISNRVLPYDGGIKLEGITGKFLGGNIVGNIYIDTTKTPSGIEVDLKLIDALVSMDTLNVKLNESNLTFSGNLPNGALPEGRSNLELKNVVLDNNGVSSTLNSSISASTAAETLYIDQGFIRGNNKEISFSGEMINSLDENRTLTLKFPQVAISDALVLLSPIIPQDFREFKTQGYAEMELVFQSLFYPQSRWGGKLSLQGSSFSGEYGSGMLIIEDVNGTINIRDKVSSDNPLAELLGEHLKLSKSIFQKFLKTFNESKLQEEDLDFLSIDKVEYGILKFENVEVALEVDTQKINIRRLLSKLFRGSFYGAGLVEFNQDRSTYDFSLLFNQISLEGISEKVSPGQEYITGRVNGLVWLTAEGADLNTVDGPFKFWSKSSSKEQRRIGAALLAKMGARERLILGSSRSYDNGNISGYINDGLITFREFEISNSILGFRNLTIQADAVRNSISISQLISTVRELARRSESGIPMIETN